MSDMYIEAKSFFDDGLNSLLDKNYIEAEILFRKAYNILPTRPSILLNLSATLIHLEKWSECTKICKQLLKQDSNNLEAIVNLGICMARLNLPIYAAELFDSALKINKSFIPALVNKGHVLQDLFNPQEALNCYKQVLDLDPSFVEAIIGTGNIYIFKKKYEEANAAFDHALQLDPENPIALCNKGMALIRLGKLKEGFKFYESRWAIPGSRNLYPEFSIPRWHGEVVHNAIIAITAEQGFGDTIQFFRYVLQLVRLKIFSRIILLAQDSLVPLLLGQHSLVEVVPLNRNSMSYVEANADFFCPLMSLPYELGIEEIDEISFPYININKELIKKWFIKLDSGSRFVDKTSSFTTPLRIGLVWSGSGHYATQINTRRDVNFSEIQKLLNIFLKSPIEFHCLQKEFRDTERLLFKAHSNLFIHSNDLISFAETAGLMSCMDLIITIDTAVAHLAGALHLPSLTLLPDPPDFLSSSIGCISRWYPSTMLLRQEVPSDWSAPINTSIQILKKLTAIKR